jgi:hypothetical protein
MRNEGPDGTGPSEGLERNPPNNSAMILITGASIGTARSVDDGAARVIYRKRTALFADAF